MSSIIGENQLIKIIFFHFLLSFSFFLSFFAALRGYLFINVIMITSPPSLSSSSSLADNVMINTSANWDMLQMGLLNENYINHVSDLLFRSP